MSYMFSLCNKLTLSSYINSTKVNNMNSMFYGMFSLISLDLSNFDIFNEKDISFMFYSCTKLIY